MAGLGLKGYRFSIGWSRVTPTGSAPANETGLAFYERIVDGLLEHGITPFITLNQWDLPQTLEESGGWSSPATIDAFTEYAVAVVERLGDRVLHSSTLA